MRSNSARSASVKNSRLAYVGERWKGVSFSSVQMPCRSGSPHGVFSDWPSACVRVITPALRAPAAATAIAAVMVNPESRSRMFVSSLERIGLDADKIRRIILGRRVGAKSLRKREILDTRRLQHRRKRIVAFDAARLVIDAVRLLALLGELLAHRPRPRPHGGVLDGHDILERAGAHARPALDQMHVLPR